MDVVEATCFVYKAFLAYVFKQFVFPLYFRLMDFTFIIIDVGELIFSGHTIKVTLYTNVQLIFPLFEPHSSEHSRE